MGEKRNHWQVVPTFKLSKVNHKGITPLNYKIQSIQDFQQPQNQKQLLRFLGMLNFYRKTLPNLVVQNKPKTPADVLQPLYTAATVKMQKNKFLDYWKDKNLSQSFQEAKDLLKRCVRHFTVVKVGLLCGKSWL